MRAKLRRSDMDFFQLTKREAAIHESGHTAVACAVRLEFQNVQVRPDAKSGWAGQCLVKKGQEMPEVKLAAFQMAGPLVQLKLLPKSVGELLALFVTSLFEHAHAFQQKRNRRAVPPVLGERFDPAQLCILC